MDEKPLSLTLLVSLLPYLSRKSINKSFKSYHKYKFSLDGEYKLKTMQHSDPHGSRKQALLPPPAQSGTQAVTSTSGAPPPWHLCALPCPMLLLSTPGGVQVLCSHLLTQQFTEHSLSWRSQEKIWGRGKQAVPCVLACGTQPCPRQACAPGQRSWVWSEGGGQGPAGTGTRPCQELVTFWESQLLPAVSRAKNDSPPTGSTFTGAIPV